MSFRVSDGIAESELSGWLGDAAKKYGTFKDGRVDYSKADKAPIVMCTIVYKKKLLLVRRGYGLADAEGYWSTVNGFIDEPKPVKDQAVQELLEELQLKVSSSLVNVAPSYALKNPKEKRSYIVFPCLVALSSQPKIELDSENTEFAWIDRKELENYHILDDLPVAIDSALELL